MPAAAGSRRTLKSLPVRVVVAIVTCLALCSLLVGRGPALAAAAQTAITAPTEVTGPPADTTTSAVVTTSLEPTPTTTVDTTAVYEEESTSGADEGVQEEEDVDATTTSAEEEVDEPVTTTTVRSTTSVAPATTRATPSTTTSAAVPSSAASSNGGATTGAGGASSGDDSQDVLRLVMATLVVVGLLIGLLTWRYWRYSDPKRGLAPARARIPISRPPAAVSGADATPGHGPVDEPPELVGAATMAPAASWPAEEHDDVALRRAPGLFDQTTVFTEDPTDPGGWTLPDRQPVRSE